MPEVVPGRPDVFSKQQVESVHRMVTARLDVGKVHVVGSEAVLLVREFALKHCGLVPP